MDPHLNEILPPPPVEILAERVDGESPEGDQSGEAKLTATFPKYTSLEEATFTVFKHDALLYYLHFHLESHDRCNVKLKPSLWDKGAYFRINLLKDGALRLIPHFMPIKLRDGTPKKRPLPSPTPAEMTPESSRPKKRRLDDAELPSALAIVGTPEKPLVSPVDVAEQEAFELEQSRRKSTLNRMNTDPTKFKPKATAPLPRDATYSNWKIDFEDAIRRRIEQAHEGIAVDTNSGKAKWARRWAHAQMIGGKFGMLALVPCTHCARAGAACRVYHPDCCEWDMEGRSPENQLGWRCERCREISDSNSTAGGCDAQFEK
ncbi:hypothetical protein CC86DRAFT_151202 [Ophiobolus disseminans]|uniref:Uncharacterized protein n=1 Tax=Ophiobolus disseminans TaxID=1469910 RepID=A0A6A6ZCJ8_9PLEO|nr:hypothetical protein CC86DRAFT_151202 [Ophiobolus disseminans]